MLLPGLVAKMSKGKYTMTSTKFAFDYFSPYLTLTGVHLKPAKPDLDEAYEVTIDSFYLSIESFLPIVFNKSINVKEIRVVNPSIVIERNKEKLATNDGSEIHEKMRSLQDNAILFLNELSVNECTIVNGSFRFYPLLDRNRYFNLEHVNLEVRDLVIPEYKGDRSAGIEGKIKLNILEPKLHLPDSLIEVSMSNFAWDNQDRYINVGNFIISQHSMPPRADSFLIALDTIRIRQLDWNAWLDSGILKVDTVVANNGNMYFEASETKPKKNPGDSLDFKKLKVWDAIGDLEVEHFSARYINAVLINRNPGHERSNSLIGDSLVIKDLSIRPERKDPLRIRDFGIGVREFVDRGANTKFQSSFSRMQVRGDTMILNNYFIQSTARSRMGKGSSLFIPILFIEGLSIRDLMEEKASIREIRMENPELILFTKMQGENTNGIKLSSKTLEEIRPFVDVERVVLNNARFTINSKTQKGVSIGTQEFSAVILSRSAMKAPDMDGFLSSFRNVNLKKFFFVTPKLRFEMQNGAVDYEHKVLHFDRAQGYINNKKIYASLVGINLVGDDELRPFNGNVMWHFKKVSVDSGMLDIRLDSAQAAAEVEDGNKLIGLIDSLNLKNIRFKIRKKDLQASGFVRNADVEGHHVYASKYSWDKSTIAVSNLLVKGKQVNVVSSNAVLTSKGISVLENTDLRIINDGMQLKLKSDHIDFNSSFNMIDGNNIVLDDLNMNAPDIALDLSPKQQTAKAGVSGSKKFEVKKFRLNEPRIAVSIVGKEDAFSLHGNGESVNGQGMLFSQSDSTQQLSINGFQAALASLRMDAQENEVFRTGRITMEMAHFIKRKEEPVMLDLKGFNVGAVNVKNIRKKDTMEIRTGGITLGYVPGLVLQRDSLIQTALKLPPTNILPSTFTFRTPEKNFSVHNFRVNTAQEYLEWDSLVVLNRISRDSFWRMQPFEKDYFTFSTGRLRADQLRPVLYGGDTTVYIRKLTVDPLNFKVERDKRMPDDTVTYRPLLTRMLKKLKFPFNIDTIRLINSLVWHNVIDEKTEKEGTIYFTNIDGYITNVKNYNYKQADSFRIGLGTRLMGKGKLRFQFREAYGDSLQGFLLAARMDSMEMSELNRLMTPLYNVRIDKGKIDELSMRVKGTNVLAYGTMDIHYNHLKVSVLNEENKRRNLISWAANLFVRGRNNKTGIVYAERLKEKSIFNYWSRISVNGLLANLGVKKNGKQVRKFYKGLEKNQLPADLF